MSRHDMQNLEKLNPRFSLFLFTFQTFSQTTNPILLPYHTLQPPNQNPLKLLKNLTSNTLFFTLFTNFWYDLQAMGGFREHG